jgi:hypothetical protein
LLETRITETGKSETVSTVTDIYVTLKASDDGSVLKVLRRPNSTAGDNELSAGIYIVTRGRIMIGDGNCGAWQDDVSECYVD